MTIKAHFDGKAFVPKEPVDLPVGTEATLNVEKLETIDPKFAWLLEVAADLPDAPEDLAHQHDHYRTGSPKR